MINKNGKSLDKFLRSIKTIFGARLLSVLGYGSFFIKSFDPDIHDIDMVIVLSGYKKSDIYEIKHAWNKFGIQYPLQCQVLYDDRALADGIFYSSGTCGPFFLSVLNNAKILYKQNLLKTLKSPGRIFYLISLLQKVQQYNYEFKNLYINLSSLSDKKHVLWFLKKKTKSILYDIDLFFSDSQFFKNILNQKEIRVLKNLKIKKDFINIEATLYEVINISEKVILAMTNHIHNIYKIDFIKNEALLADREVLN